MTLQLEKIGDANVIRIPEELMARYHIGAAVELTETATGFLLEPAKVEKLSFEDSLDAMAKEFAENQAELNAWDVTLADGLEDDEFEGWPR